jgi:transposase
LIVGIDVHKHTHAVALIDDRGGEIATLIIPNTPKGYRSLIDWLVDQDAATAVIGVESPGSYGRCLVTALAGAGFEVLQVPAWRTHRERHRRGPGKTDPGDAISIAHVVRTKRADLGAAEEPELVRALGMLELQRRRFVRDRTQAIQRLRSDWTQHDPVAEAGVIRCDRQRELNKLRRLQLGSSLAARTAARCIRELARDIADLNTRMTTRAGHTLGSATSHPSAAFTTNVGRTPSRRRRGRGDRGWIARPPRQEMRVIDPDGYVLMVAQIA